MLLLEERERLTEIQELLLKLYILRRYAVEDGDGRRTRTINKEITSEGGAHIAASSMGTLRLSGSGEQRYLRRCYGR